MGATYHVESTPAGSVDVLRDVTTGVRVHILRTGAEMVSLARRNAAGEWIGFLYRDNELSAPASGWSNHATVMGYFLHRLVNEKSIYDGDEIHGGNHGFLRHFHFPAPVFDAVAASLTYEVLPGQIPADAYPRPVSCKLSYLLTANGVRVQFEFKNFDRDRPAHVSFGIHPGFALSSVASASIELPAGTYHRFMAPGNFLDGQIETIPFDGGPMPFDKAKLEDSYLLGIGDLTSRNMVIKDGTRSVELDFSEVPYMTLWSSGDDFICVEPCWGLPDSIPQKPFEEKVGIQTISAGGSISAGFTISVYSGVIKSG